MNAHSQALSIFKFAHSYYRKSSSEESSESREISQQLSQTSNELVQHSLNSSSSTTETTTTISESVYQDVFFTTISSSKTIESSTMALAKKLVVQHMAKKNYTAAISVIHATLQRTWSSFLANSIHDVTMATVFTQESIELVERLAECYLQTRQLERVDDVYSRFFRGKTAYAVGKVGMSVLVKGLGMDFEREGLVEQGLAITGLWPAVVSVPLPPFLFFFFSFYVS